MIQNQQLFSEAYVREVRLKAHALDVVSACRQTIQEWREEYPDLTDASKAASYVRQVLSSLGVTYAQAEHGFRLLAGAGRGDATGLCLVVADDDLGRATKGRHHQVLLVRRLREANLSWGVLTNGARWRLCHAGSPAPYEVFLEADLDALLASKDTEAFSGFFHFFGKEAFAKVEGSTASKTGLDTFLAASEKRTEAIERHLKSRIESLLQTLCLGFVQDEAAGEYSREKLDAIYKNSIYLLYRLLFLFYAEARNLLPTDLPAYAEVSLASLVADARNSQQDGAGPSDPHAFWKRLRHLFAVVDYGDSAVGVEAYNGGLFSDEEKPYLKDHHITNDFLAPALFALGFEETKTGFQAINYRDLSVRHLGTLYEGLLEYRLNLVLREPVVVREASGKRLFLPESQAHPIKKSETVLEVGQVYFADDKGERKSSGSYYTPEDVVQYIVGNTVTPKLLERRAALDTLLEELRREHEIAPTDDARAQVASYADGLTLKAVQRDILSLRVLDPAMGSGHFLVAAGQVMTNFVIETLNATPWANDALPTDPLLWKRRVVERCLYGVDKNDLAQELAKLALWISSASVGKPLTFLDHHLKCGNSLYGAPLRRLSILPTSKSTKNNNLFGDLSDAVLRDLTAQIGKITGADSDRIADVKKKGEFNRQAQELTCRLSDIANVWLASLFDLRGDAGKPLTDDHYAYLLNMATQNRAAESWESLVRGNCILADARAIADEKEFFHWELEFPDSVVEGECRFDAVVANPPYVGTKADKAITALYETAKCGDLYAWILERAMTVCGDRGNIGTIIPLSIMFAGDKKYLRQLLLKEKAEIHLSSFDIRPDSIFGTTDAPNSQRATIALLSRQRPDGQMYTTDFLRWSRDERAVLFDSLKFSSVTTLADEKYFPCIGDYRLSEFLTRLRSSGSTLNDGTNSKGEIVLCVQSAARYFISSVPVDLGRRNQELIKFENERARNVAFALINSNVFYWYWRSRSDGFWVSRDQILNMPVPATTDDLEPLLILSNHLWSQVQEHRVRQISNGKLVTTYYFNRCMDILLDIDDWIVKHVAPNLNLPRDIFAQYKSNSFLRPLDLSAITGAAAELESRE